MKALIAAALVAVLMSGCAVNVIKVHINQYGDVKVAA